MPQSETSSPSSLPAQLDLQAKQDKLARLVAQGAQGRAVSQVLWALLESGGFKVSQAQLVKRAPLDRAVPVVCRASRDLRALLDRQARLELRDR